MKKIVTLCLCLTGITLFAQYPVGHISVNFKDASRTGGYSISGGTTFPTGGTGRDIGTEIYYPAVTAGNNTTVAAGQFPVIVFGHGFAMGWDSYTTFFDSMARNGFVIALARTEGSLIPAPSHLDFGKDLAYIANQLMVMNATGGSFFYNKLTGREAIGGHSMGGGATFLADAYTNNNVVCYFTFAAAETNPSAVTAAATITKPHLVLSGTYDCVAPPATNQTLMYNALASSCKTQLNITKAYHCAFADNNFNCGFGEGTCITAGGLSSTLQQQIVRNYLEPYLDYYLKGVCPAWTKFQNMVDTATISAVTQSCNVIVPQNVAIAGNNYYCHNDSTLLQAQPTGFQYTWSNGSSASSVFVSQPATYSVSVSNGVCSLSSSALAVHEKAAPGPISVITFPDTMCSGISNLPFSVMNDTLADSYVWNFPVGWAITQGAGTSSILVTSGDSIGLVSVYALNGCGTSDTASQWVMVLPSNLGAAGAITGDTVVCQGDTATYLTPLINGAMSYAWTYPSGWTAAGAQNGSIISLIADGNGGQLTVGGVNSCGVGVTSSKSISVGYVPAGGAVTGLDSVCAGTTGSATYLLTPNPTDGNILWTLPTGWTIINGQGSNMLTVSYNGNSGPINCAVTNGCGTTNCLPLTFTVLDTPAVTVTDNGTGLTATAPGAVSYQWYFNGSVISGETSSGITPTQTGNYACLISNGNCSGTGSIDYFFDAVTDLQKLPFSFINPVSNTLEIRTADFANTTAAVYDMQGKVVMQTKLSASQSFIDVSSLSAGLYLLRLQMEGRSFAKKLTIQR